MKKENVDFLEVNMLLNRVEKQHEELRKVTGEGEPYKHLAKQKHVTVYTDDKKAMKFWEE
ncbi:hypothetical protein L8956_26560 (plasmid) [Peribacillus frigoritolerans]|uniref:hypothetical protein n=1 Tax=Peribacillus frigoritolerans TaxID=450367 RepID=UPI001EFD9342|nr:hypothetical protein [Peribacillus frigoritolerans]ULM99895.1 hypothetical protein L8956_26560 [Peribacillus frigoritolerans]